MWPTSAVSGLLLGHPGVVADDMVLTQRSREHWVEPIAHVLNKLGCEHVWVVHGHDGLDELTTTKRVLDLGCGDGKLLKGLLAEKQSERA